MKHLLLFLIILLPINSLLAFDLKTIDETKEGIEKSLEIIRAPDGKVIVKTTPKNILKPMKLTIIKGYQPTVKPIKRRIIYPIGTLPPKSVEQENIEPTSIIQKEDSVFLSSDNISDKKTDEISINIDTDFTKSSGATTPKKSRTIAPVNIE